MLAFATFAGNEVGAWLKRAGRDAEVMRAFSPAQLHAFSTAQGDDAPQPYKRQTFGFGRALR